MEADQQQDLETWPPPLVLRRLHGETEARPRILPQGARHLERRRIGETLRSDGDSCQVPLASLGHHLRDAIGDGRESARIAGERRDVFSGELFEER